PISLGAATSIWLKLRRTGNTWTGSWSTDGTNFTAGVTYAQAYTITKVGPFAGNAGSPVPAFTASVDYFFNTASPISPGYGGGSGHPIFSAVTATPTTNGATITWVTDRATTSQVAYGLTTAYGSTTAVNNTPVVSHSVVLTGLICGTLYHYKAIS